MKLFTYFYGIKGNFSFPEVISMSNAIGDLFNFICSLPTEKMFNMYKSMHSPYCSLCMMFTPKRVFKKIYFNIFEITIILSS